MRHKTQSLKSVRNLFADGTNVSTSVESMEELEKRLNSDLKNIYQCSSNRIYDYCLSL